MKTVTIDLREYELLDKLSNWAAEVKNILDDSVLGLNSETLYFGPFDIVDLKELRETYPAPDPKTRFKEE